MSSGLKKIKKKFGVGVYIASFFSVALLAQFCGPSLGGGQQAEPVELVVWRVFDEKRDLESIFRAYSELNPNVRFVFEGKDIATYEDDLLEALAAGSGPDIFSIHNDWLPRYRNKLQPAPPGLFSLREYSESFIDVASQDLIDETGAIYAVPFSVDTLSLFYNRDLLGSAGIPEPPRTWEELISAVKKLNQQDRFGNFLVNGVAMGTDANVNRATDILSLLMLQNGTQIYDAQRRNSNLRRDIAAPGGERYNPGAQALEFYTQFSNPAKEVYSWNATNNHSIDAFVAGQAAMMFSYSYTIENVRGKAPFLNFGVAPMPQIDLTKPRINFSNYFAEGVSKASPNADQAWDFLQFATSKEQLENYYAAKRVPASRKDIIASQIADPEIGIFAEGSLTAKTFYKPDSNKVETIFSEMINDVVLRGVTPEQAVSTAEKLLNGLIK